MSQLSDLSVRLGIDPRWLGVVVFAIFLAALVHKALRRRSAPLEKAPESQAGMPAWLRSVLLAVAAAVAIWIAAQWQLSDYSFLFTMRLSLIFTALLVALPVAALGWPAAMSQLLGNLLVGLHPAKPLFGRGPTFLAGDILITSCWLFAAAWSAMFTWSLVARSSRAELLGDYDASAALVSWPQATLFTLVALLGVGVVVAMARTDGGRGTRTQAVFGAVVGAVLAAASTHLLALPALRSGADFLPLDLPTFRALAGEARWAADLYRWISEASVRLEGSVVRSFLLETTPAGPRLRPDHYFASFAMLALLGLLVVGYLRNRKGIRRRRPAAVYLLTLIVFLIWALLGIQVRLGTWTPVWLIFLLWLIIPGRVLPSADHYFSIGPLEEADLIEASGLAMRAGDERPCDRMVIACGAGGGILSAGWVTWVLARLAEGRPELARELRLVSGASGGSVGFAFLIERLLQGGDEEPAKLFEEAHERAVGSSLASVAFGLAYADLLRFSSLQLTTLARDGKLWDRGLLLQLAWRRNAEARESVRPGTDPELVAAIREHRAPAPILNTTSIEGGKRVMITPLTFGREGGRRAPTLAELLGAPAGVDIWTAAQLSATFPFVSPATRPLWEGGLSGSIHHFVDGGYADNFGVASALDALNEILADPSRCPRKIALLEITPFPTSSAENALPGWAAAAFGPLAGLLKAHFGIQLEANSRALDWYSNSVDGRAAPEFEYFRFEPSAGEEGPLSWHLTQAEKEALRAGWGANPANEANAKALSDFLD